MRQRKMLVDPTTIEQRRTSTIASRVTSKKSRQVVSVSFAPSASRIRGARTNDTTEKACIRRRVKHEKVKK
jgi:hypothetical protein